MHLNTLNKTTNQIRKQVATQPRSARSASKHVTMQLRPVSKPSHAPRRKQSVCMRELAHWAWVLSQG